MMLLMLLPNEMEMIVKFLYFFLYAFIFLFIFLDNVLLISERLLRIYQYIAFWSGFGFDITIREFCCVKLKWLSSNQWSFLPTLFLLPITTIGNKPWMKYSCVIDFDTKISCISHFHLVFFNLNSILFRLEDIWKNKQETINKIKSINFVWNSLIMFRKSRTSMKTHNWDDCKMI